MKQLAEGVHQLRGWPPDAINVYLVGDVLIDAATRQGERRIMREIASRRVTVHALTHAHPDHQGATREVCEAFGIPLWCGELDAEAVEDGRIMDRQPKHPINSIIGRIMPGPAYPVARRLHEGDQVAGFKVLDVPGHSAGHVAYWRESDRALVCGDVFTNVDTITGIPGLHEPRSFFTPDPARNRDSMRRLAALEPALVCFGHGWPLRDPAKLRAFADKLPRD